MMIKATQRPGEAGIYFPVNRRKAKRAREAKPTRHSTIVSGVIYFTTTLAKKKEPPQTIDKRMIRPHSFNPITLLIVELSVSAFI
jgi:hypothetical protein